MKRSGSFTRWISRVSLFCAVGSLLSTGTSTDAVAQFGGGGGGLSPDKQEVAWTIQAKGMAKQLGLSEEATKKLIETYKKSRKDQNKATRELRMNAGGDRRSATQKIREQRGKDQGTLKKSVGEFLNEDQTSKAMSSLGTFNSQWDRMVDTLANLSLPEEKLNKSLEQVQSYVTASDKAQSEGMASGDRRAIRESMQKLKGELDGKLGAILTEEQQKKWSEATQQRGRQGGGQGQGRRGQGRRGQQPGSQGTPPASQPSSQSSQNVDSEQKNMTNMRDIQIAKVKDIMDVGVKVGEKIPEFELADQTGESRDFDSLKGPKGLLLVFHRSADW